VFLWTILNKYQQKFKVSNSKHYKYKYFYQGCPWVSILWFLCCPCSFALGNPRLSMLNRMKNILLWLIKFKMCSFPKHQ
jgi:hypothetical protein